MRWGPGAGVEAAQLDVLGIAMRGRCACERIVVQPPPRKLNPFDRLRPATELLCGEGRLRRGIAAGAERAGRVFGAGHLCMPCMISVQACPSASDEVRMECCA